MYARYTMLVIVAAVTASGCAAPRELSALPALDGVVPQYAASALSQVPVPDVEFDMPVSLEQRDFTDVQFGFFCGGVVFQSDAMLERAAVWEVVGIAASDPHAPSIESMLRKVTDPRQPPVFELRRSR